MSEVKGLKELIKALEKLPKELDNDLEDVVFANGQEIELNAKKNAPVDTGKLQQSIKAIKIGKLTVNIKANATGLAPYAVYVEYGEPVGTGPNGGPKPFLFPAFFRQKKIFLEDIKALVNTKIKKL